MKKQFFLFTILLAACAVAANAQTQPSTANGEKTENVLQDKTEIKADALPEAVKKTLATDEFKGWEIAKAYVAKEMYDVELKKGTETKTVKLDKEGKVIK